MFTTQMNLKGIWLNLNYTKLTLYRTLAFNISETITRYSKYIQGLFKNLKKKKIQWRMFIKLYHDSKNLILPGNWRYDENPLLVFPLLFQTRWHVNYVEKTGKKIHQLTNIYSRPSRLQSIVRRFFTPYCWRISSLRHMHFYPVYVVFFILINPVIRQERNVDYTEIETNSERKTYTLCTKNSPDTTTYSVQCTGIQL